MLSLSVIKEVSNMPQSQILMKVGLEINVPELGQRIRDARHKTGRTITQLAAEADISVANWYAIEQERVKVLPLTTLRRIEQVLKFDFGVN
jgi:ribosome-binding protein aMBF1 (putative translation factor)